jgi:hypothetical protein
VRDVAVAVDAGLELQSTNSAHQQTLELTKDASELTNAHLPTILGHAKTADMQLLYLPTLPPAQRAQILANLRNVGSVNASGRRILSDAQWAGSYWWGTTLRDSCKLLQTLVLFDQGDAAHTLQQQWLRSIFDQYANALDRYSTQEAVSCLAAAYAYGERWIGPAPENAIQVSAHKNKWQQPVLTGLLSAQTPLLSAELNLGKALT